MKGCEFIYCKYLFDDQLAECPICGYPAQGQDVRELSVIESKLAGWHIRKLIDMHQIIPNEAGALDLQFHLMKQLKIERVLLQSVPTQVTSILSNKPLFDLQSNHPTQFLASHFLDPRHPFARRRLRQYSERGIKVIKLLPCLGYRPDEKRWDKFWSTMTDLGLVAMIHTGFITARHKAEEKSSGIYLSSTYGQPIYFDLLARKFPDLQLILCHMGGSMWYEQAAAMVSNHDNVWGDISGFGHLALKRITKQHVELDWHKVFWGNDSAPAMYPYNLRLTLHYLDEAGLSTLSEAVFYQNAHRFIRRFID